METRYVRFGPHPGRQLRKEQELPEDATLEEKVIAALRTVYDPELPVNIYDLGLIYKLQISGNGEIDIEMTLTAPACPVAGTMPGKVEQVLRELPGVTAARAALVWDPPWTQERISEAARLELGLL